MTTKKINLFKEDKNCQVCGKNLAVRRTNILGSLQWTCKECLKPIPKGMYQAAVQEGGRMVKILQDIAGLLAPYTSSEPAISVFDKNTEISYTKVALVLQPVVDDETSKSAEMEYWMTHQGKSVRRDIGTLKRALKIAKAGGPGRVGRSNY